MNSTALKRKPPDLDAAFAHVLEAFRSLLSAEMSSRLQDHRKTIAAIVLAFVCLHLGIVLAAMGIRDAVYSALPNHAATALLAFGFAAMFSAACLLLIFRRPKRP